MLQAMCHPSAVQVLVDGPPEQRLLPQVREAARALQPLADDRQRHARCWLPAALQPSAATAAAAIA
eukprot:COSAG06_NODE_17422_length_942_cov_0.860024_1_plen_65_part_10